MDYRNFVLGKQHTKNGGYYNFASLLYQAGPYVPTAIQEVYDQTADNRQPSTGDGAVYDLLGRQVGNRQSLNGRLPKGVYICNGRKIVVRK